MIFYFWSCAIFSVISTQSTAVQTPAAKPPAAQPPAAQPTGADGQTSFWSRYGKTCLKVAAGVGIIAVGVVVTTKCKGFGLLNLSYELAQKLF